MQGDLSPIACQVGDDLDLAIRNRMHCASVITQHGHAKRHLFDSPLNPCNFNDVSEVIDVIDDDEEAVEYVLYQSLGAEAHRQSDDARARQERLYIDTDVVKDLQEREEEDDEAADTLDN